MIFSESRGNLPGSHRVEKIPRNQTGRKTGERIKNGGIPPIWTPTGSPTGRRATSTVTISHANAHGTERIPSGRPEDERGEPASALSSHQPYSVRPDMRNATNRTKQHHGTCANHPRPVSVR